MRLRDGGDEWGSGGEVAVPAAMSTHSASAVVVRDDAEDGGAVPANERAK